MADNAIAVRPSRASSEDAITTEDQLPPCAAEFTRKRPSRHAALPRAGGGALYEPQPACDLDRYLWRTTCNLNFVRRANGRSCSVPAAEQDAGAACGVT